MIDEGSMSNLKPGKVLSAEELDSAIHYMYGGDHDLMQNLIKESHALLRINLAKAMEVMKNLCERGIGLEYYNRICQELGYVD